MRLSCFRPLGSTARHPPLSSVSSTPQTTLNTLTSPCKPNWAKVNNDTYWGACGKCRPLFFVLASLQLSFKHLYIRSDCSLPEDWWQIWYNQFQPCIPGRWTRAPRDAPCQRSTAWPWSCSHLCRLQAGSHFGWCASRVWVTSTRSQQGGTQDAAVKRTGEWEVCSWERKKKSTDDMVHGNKNSDVSRSHFEYIILNKKQPHASLQPGWQRVRAPLNWIFSCIVTVTSNDFMNFFKNNINN